MAMQARWRRERASSIRKASSVRMGTSFIVPSPPEPPTSFRKAVEFALARRGVPLPGWLSSTGVCPVCEERTRFAANDPWLRDHFVCVKCMSRPRERALVAVLNMYFPQWREMAVHESSPALRSSAKLAREGRDYTSSYFDPATPKGEAIAPHGVRNENLEDQTFGDERFDLVITQDVFEHLFDPGKAIHEIARTLKPGGAHVCTVPIGRKTLASQWRARRSPDGEVEHILPPIYHGNPMDNAGSLVTIDYGYDIADFFDSKSGLNTTLVFIDDLSRGIRAEFIEVLVSRKPSETVWFGE